MGALRSEIHPPGDQFLGGDIVAGWNHQPATLGLSVDDLRDKPDGVRVPHPFADAKFAGIGPDGKARGFDTPTRRVALIASACSITATIRSRTPSPRPRSGCRVGQRGSCAVTVIEGQVARRIPFDGPPGSSLACQAVPLTDLTIAP